MNHNRRIAVLCGLFVSATTLIDWYLNAPLRRRPFSEKERYLYEHFLDRPIRVLEPPTTIGKIWIAVMIGIVAFWLGVMAYRLVTGEYRYLLRLRDSVYSRAALLISLAPGIALGYVIAIGPCRLPTVWKIYQSMFFALLAHFVIFMILIAPYQLYRWRGYAPDQQGSTCRRTKFGA